MSETGNIKKEAKFSTIEIATQHFKKITDNPIKITVEEWVDPENGEPIVIFATPLTLKQMQMIQKKTKGDEVEALAEVLIMKAKKEDGSSHFTLTDKPVLMRSADTKVIGEIAKQIVGDQFYNEDNVEEFKKN